MRPIAIVAERDFTKAGKVVTLHQVVVPRRSRSPHSLGPRLDSARRRSFFRGGKSMTSPTTARVKVGRMPPGEDGERTSKRLRSDPTAPWP
jgi:hypothetical protein